MRAVVPPPVRGSSVSMPPCSATMRWASASPRPTPPGRSVAKGWKRRPRISGEMPGPRSRMAISKRSSRQPVAISRCRRAAALLRLDGVAQQVAQGALEQLRIAGEPRAGDAAASSPPLLDAATSRASSAGSAAAWRTRRREVDRHQPRGARLGEAEEVGDHALQPLGLAAQLVEVFGGERPARWRRGRARAASGSRPAVARPLRSSWATPAASSPRCARLSASRACCRSRSLAVRSAKSTR